MVDPPGGSSAAKAAKTAEASGNELRADDHGPEAVDVVLSGLSVSVLREGGDWPALDVLAGEVRTGLAATLARVAPPAGAEVNVLFSDDARVRTLNAAFRGKDAPTNVLSFPSPENPFVTGGEGRTRGRRAVGGGALPLGDVVLAHGVTAREAAEAGLSEAAHRTHLIVHGVLHLMGYDHEDERGAERMERLESGILTGLGFADPHADPHR